MSEQAQVEVERKVYVISYAKDGRREHVTVYPAAAAYRIVLSLRAAGYDVRTEVKS